MDCGWSIRLNTTGLGLNFKFTAFDLEESTNCSADYVELRDGTDKTANLIGNSIHLTCKRIEKKTPPRITIAGFITQGSMNVESLLSPLMYVDNQIYRRNE